MRTPALCLLLLVSGCRGCVGGAGGVTTEPIRVSGGPLRFEDTWVGTERSLTLELSNPSRVAQTVTVAVDAPFFLGASEISVAGGGAEQVAVTFRPTSPGVSAAVLTVGQTPVELSGLGLEVPACVPATTCEAAAFDTEQGQCLRAPRPDGAACAEQCVMGGQCQAGACVGAPIDCSDADACTVDACGAEGCAHTPRTCPPPTNPCKVAACDSTSGCGELDADDGTVCGSDACTEANASVCIAGQCVQRTRPITERCSNTWVPLRLPSVTRAPIAWDPVRSQMVTLAQRQTWLWDGTEWTQRFPPSVAAGALALVTDTRRNRVVAFAGAETWEWDGVTWLLRAPSTAAGPGYRVGTSMAYDPVRGVTVLFGGMFGSTPTDETWEWNGLRWTRRAPAHAPSPRFGAAMAWDPSRQRVVLVAGTFDYFVGSSDTWEFDGVDWVLRSVAVTPPPRYDSTLVWDDARDALVLIAGTAYDPLDDLWELSSTGWTFRGRTPNRMYAVGAAWDPRAARIVALSSGVTFHYDGQTLVPASRAVPSERNGPAVAFDPARAQTLLFGGYPSLSSAPLYPSANDTWVRDATRWTELALTVRPSARYGAALTWDPVRQQLVLFGGSSEINSPGGVVGRKFSDTWTFDGAAWSQLTPTASPAAGAGVGTWDEAMQRVVVMSGGTWAFDGTTWSSVATGGPPAWTSTLAYDPRAQRLMAVNRAETWAVINGAWTLLAPTTPLPATSTTGRLVWDPSRQRVLLQGDRSTFAWDGADWTRLQPTAQPLETPEALVFDGAAGRPVAITRGGEWTLLP